MTRVAKSCASSRSLKLPKVGVWPAAAAYFSFACLELTTGMANRPWLVALLALVYSAVTLAGMFLFGRDEWLEHCEAFTVLFSIVGRFSPIEAERDETGRITHGLLRPWGVGLLKPSATGWDRVVFVILMLSTLAFDGILATPSWQDFTIALEPIWLPMGAFGFFFVEDPRAGPALSRVPAGVHHVHGAGRLPRQAQRRLEGDGLGLRAHAGAHRAGLQRRPQLQLHGRAVAGLDPAAQRPAAEGLAPVAGGGWVSRQASRSPRRRRSGTRRWC